MFNISLHVPALQVEEIVRVMHVLGVFQESDIPAAVDALTTHCSRTVPMKKLLLWIEMAKQVRGEDSLLLASKLFPTHGDGCAELCAAVASQITA